MSEAFFPIRLNTLRSDEEVSFDVYLRLGDRYLHYSRGQEEMEGERLRRLKAKGVRKLYIHPNDEATYLRYLELGLENLTDASKDIQERGATAHTALVMASENAEKNLETKEGFETQKKQFEKISDFIVSDRQAIKNILTAAGFAIDHNHHAANVSSLALSVASKAGMDDKTELFELGTAALLHDIGKNRLKFDHMKSIEKMTPEEVRKFKMHPLDGVDMLSGKPYISPRILGLIASHEEYGEGRGFPDKKNVFTQPLAYQVLTLTNHFDHFATEQNLGFSAAVDAFYDKMGKHFDEQLIAVLATVLA